jgi:release factor glutamine methyltransferase
MNDGYKFYRLISNLSASNLKRGGCLFFELGENQYAKVRSIMIGNGFSGIESKNDLAGIVRLIWGVKN